MLTRTTSTSSAQTCCVDLAELGLSASGDWRDLLGEAVHAADGTALTVTLDGYAVHWLAQVKKREWLN
ncbi:MAG: hypothetical protein R2873_06605 [Caldilineaceae bacterium]